MVARQPGMRLSRPHTGFMSVSVCLPIFLYCCIFAASAPIAAWKGVWPCPYFAWIAISLISGWVSLESAGQKFDSAQHQFAVAAQAIAGATTGAGSSGRLSPPPSGSGSSGSSSGSSSSGSGSSGGEHWSGIGELDQFHSPLHSSVIVLDGKLSSISRNQKAAIERMRQALHSFLELNESEKSAYLGRLQALDTKFTYRRPEEMADIIKSYNQARSAFEALSMIA